MESRKVVHETQKTRQHTIIKRQKPSILEPEEIAWKKLRLPVLLLYSSELPSAQLLVYDKCRNKWWFSSNSRVVLGALMKRGKLLLLYFLSSQLLPTLSPYLFFLIKVNRCAYFLFFFSSCCCKMMMRMLVEVAFFALLSSIFKFYSSFGIL